MQWGIMRSKSPYSIRIGESLHFLKISRNKLLFFYLSLKDQSYFLRLCLAQKRFANAFILMFRSNAKIFEIAILVFLSLFFLLVAYSGRTGKSFLSNLYQLLLQTCVTKIESTSLHTSANYCI